MERCVFTHSNGPMSLSDILGLQNQPICEEQAWALCYQLCSLLEPNFATDLEESFGSWKTFRLPGPEGILFSTDGSISLRIDNTKSEPDEQFLMETEDQTVYYVGRLMYSCLDWGLGADVERELDKTLELLVSQMTKVDIRSGAEHCLQPICSISEVLQVCEERLYNPSQASQHYRSVCSTLYSHTVELCHYLQIVQQTKESLQKMILVSETTLVQNVTNNWEFVWRDLMDELSKGVVLRPPKIKLNSDSPGPVDTSPFTQLLQDIQLRRYTLRKVQAGRSGRIQSDPHQALLEVIRSGPKLRPVSERNLKPRVPNRKQERSLHELLMQEIRSTDRIKLLSSKRKESCNADAGCCPENSRIPIYEHSSNEDTSFFLNTPNPSPQGAPSQRRPCKGSSPPHEESLTGSSDCNLRFYPVLSSSPLSPTAGSRHSQRKRRARSIASNRELCHRALENKSSVPLTIADVIKGPSSSEGKVKATPCDTYRNWRICSCCSKRSLYFTWHHVCSLCSRVLCPGCCVEMRLPFKWCINLPLSFFKKIVLNKESEQSQRNFWNERWSWDPSWVPLVLEPRVSGSVSLPTLAMRDWHSQDLCVCCQGLLIEACDTVQSHCPVTNPREI
ncbi:protein spire homolog 1 isoform X3 [Hoplias malabaricus]|uniref:protein spire homolog 1 isoform X3 n=1 Tax=Hoplias malabaricus TaxID=27720 RepID=UPI003463779C